MSRTVLFSDFLDLRVPFFVVLHCLMQNTDMMEKIKSDLGEADVNIRAVLYLLFALSVSGSQLRLFHRF